MNDMEIKTVHMAASEYIEKYRDIPQFLEYCKACPRYNKCWACPEHGFDVEDYLTPYEHVYLIGAKVAVDENLQKKVKGADVGAMAESITKEARKVMDPIVLSLEERIPDSLCCYGGTCYLCETCQKEEGKLCVYPHKRRPSLEAVGFDIAATTEELFGFKLLWSSDSLPEYITVVSALFAKNEIPERL